MHQLFMQVTSPEFTQGDTLILGYSMAMDEKLWAVPVQLMPINGGAILKRGSCLVTVHGEGAAETLRRILSCFKATGVRRAEIYRLFPSSEHHSIGLLIDKLVKARILVDRECLKVSSDTPESSLDVFYWHFNQSAEEVTTRINAQSVVILGVNTLTRYMVDSFCASGITNFKVVDYPPLRNLRLFNESGSLLIDQWRFATSGTPVEFEEWSRSATVESFDSLIATSDFLVTEQFRHWNRLCVNANRTFIPICLTDVGGLVGPIVVPGETACYECYWSRRNSNLSRPEYRQAVEESAFVGQLVSGLHPSIAGGVANLAAFEVTKYCSESLCAPNVGILIEIEALSPSITKRKVLKAPRCQICSPLLSHSSTTVYKDFLGPMAERGT